MQRWQKVLLGILSFTIGLYLVAILTGYGYLLKAAWATYLHGYNSGSIGDARYFDTREIPVGSNVWEWPLHPDYNRQDLSNRLSQSLQETNSVAFLVIQSDSIIQEHYWDGYSDSSQSNSFSMAKSVVSMLAQIAIQKGHFTGWDQKVKDFFPELTGPYADELELWHLSTMSSGMDWEEHYHNPFGVTAKAYYGDDLDALMLSLPIVDEPGQRFIYQSGSPQLLGMCLVKATGKSLSALASDWLWKPLGAKHSAKWHLDDKDGMELAYCCFNSNARDFARFGKLMTHYGNWNGNQILDSSFVDKAGVGALSAEYSYSFWVDTSEATQVYFQHGILGQYIINIPEYNLVVVRLGHQEGEYTTDEHPDDFHVIVEEVLKMYTNAQVP